MALGTFGAEDTLCVDVQLGGEFSEQQGTGPHHEAISTLLMPHTADIDALRRELLFRLVPSP